MESFATSAAEADGKGTVLGRLNPPETEGCYSAYCTVSCNGTCDATCPQTCAVSCAGVTHCGAVTCDPGVICFPIVE